MFKRAFENAEAETHQKLWKSRSNFSGLRRTDWDTGRVEWVSVVQTRRNWPKRMEAVPIPEEEQEDGVEGLWMGMSDHIRGLETLITTLEQETDKISLETDTLETLFQTLSVSLLSEKRVKEAMETTCLADQIAARETMEEIAGVQNTLGTERSKLTAIARDEHGLQIYLETLSEQCRCIEASIEETRVRTSNLTEEISAGEDRVHVLRTQVAKVLLDAVLVEAEAKTDQLAIEAATVRLNDFLSLNS
jgi:chromosome segregation ATPase